MLRRTCGRLAPFGSPEASRIKREKTRRFLYDEDGNIHAGNYMKLFISRHGKEVAVVVGILVFIGSYDKVIHKLIIAENEAGKGLERRSEEEIRGMGKLKADRFLVKPQRYVDDPDYYNIPGKAGPRGKSCDLFVDDERSADMYSNRRGGRPM